MFAATIAIFLSLFLGLSAGAQDLKRSDFADKFWIEGAAGISPDSGVFHGEGSAVADRRDVTIRYQHGTLGLIANWHRLIFDSELEQESYQVNNRIWALGFTFRYILIEKGGFLGGSHFVGYLMGQSGRSDYHYYEGPSGGAKAEVKADTINASGFSSGVDLYFPVVYGLWFFAGGGWESNSFSYKITTDPNDDGKVNIRQTFTYLRGGLAFSF
jgi:hypothetical protein